MADRLILVGKALGAFGVRGEIRLTAYTADPMALAEYKTLLREDGRPALTVLSARPVKGGVVAKVRELDSKEAADALRGLTLHVPRTALPPTEDDDEFYLADLIGLTAVAPHGAPLGRVKAVENYGADDLLEIDPGDGTATWLLPFTREAVPTVDLAAGRLTVVRPLEIEPD